ncbi:MAG TPA: VOC family protein [Flavisolibacter sp.]
MSTIVHFDISADDLNRAKIFYENLFGWSIDTLEGFPDYYEIETVDVNGKQGVGGGITKRTDSMQAGITNFIGVQSIDDSLEKLSQLGGKVLQAKQEILGYGWLAVCTDTENNVIGLFEDLK